MEIKKVVCFKQSSIGDCLMGKYFLEQVHEQWPRAKLAIVVTSRGSMIKDLFAAYSWIEVVEVNRRSPRKIWYLLKQYLGSDLVTTEYTSGRIGMFTKLAARILALKGKLLGFDDRSPFSHFFYTRILPLGGRRVAPRTLEKQLLEAVGIPLVKDRFTLDYTKQPELLKRLNLVDKNYVVVHLFSGSINRGLSPKRQQDLVDELAKTLPNMPLIFTGTPKEHGELKKLSLPQGSQVVTTTVQEVIHLIDHARLMVSLGTGTSHIAAHLNVPLVVFANCQGVQWIGQEQWGNAPIAPFCNPTVCQGGHDNSSYAKCIETVDMQKVAEAAKNFYQTIH